MSQPGRAPLALRVGTLIDGLAPAAVHDAVVAIDGNLISFAGRYADFAGRSAELAGRSADSADFAGRSAELAGRSAGGDELLGRPAGVFPDEGTSVLDLRPLVAIPGLIDAHTHLTLLADERSYEEHAAEPDGYLLLAAAHNARTHLEAGVTTVRDNGSRSNLALLLREAIERGAVLGPRLLASGPVITKPRGHFHFFGHEADSAGEVVAAVEALAAAGVDHIKVMASGGETLGTDPLVATYSVEELRAGVTAAHSHELLSTAHCRALESMRRAAEARVDCIEHAEFLRPDGTIRFDSATAAAMAAAGAFISPTLPAYGWHTIVRLRAVQEQRPLSDAERALRERFERDTEAVTDNLRQMIDHGLGGRIVASTDAGCADVTFGRLDYCAELMGRAGMEPMQVLKACTSVAAEALGLGDRLGAIAPGRLADVVLLGDDPLRRIGAVADVRAVLRDGKVVVSHLDGLAVERSHPLALESFRQGARALRSRLG